jgi:hypothetical protein
LLPHVWDGFDMKNAKDNGHSDRSSKEAVVKVEGRNLVDISGETP